jgi:hypothetical protein
MSVSVRSVSDAKRLRPRCGYTREKEIESAQRLEAWCDRHGVKRVQLRCWLCCPCQLGHPQNFKCKCGRRDSNSTLRSELGSWDDHGERFVRGRTNVIYTSEPYHIDDREAVQRFFNGVGAFGFLHPKNESFYYPDSAHLVVFVPRSEAEAYAAREPTAEAL